MKKLIQKILSSLVIAGSLLAIQPAWAAVPASSEEINEYTVTCTNGTFIGTTEQETGVVTFKGIPFAEQPVGKLRWKAPEPARESSAVFKAQEYGPISFQLPNPYNGMTAEKMGEDCLNLNIWTSDLKKQKKPVMVWIHGGIYATDDASSAMYNGQFLADTYKDLVVVTVNYRLGAFGFIDLSMLDGGEKYPDSQYLGYLDVKESLSWIKKNIEAFGGDPENITVFGESVGGTLVDCLMSDKTTEGLFQHAISQSGPHVLMFAQHHYDENKQTEKIMQAVGAETLADLQGISAEKFIELYCIPVADEGRVGPVNCLAFLNGYPLRGGDSPIPADMPLAIENGVNKDVDYIIGTNANENRYLMSLMGKASFDENILAFVEFQDRSIETFRKRITAEENRKLDRYLQMPIFPEDRYSAQYKEIWRHNEFLNERIFRMPAVRLAEAHVKAGGKGKTYMYYFCKPVETLDFFKAVHGCEIAYVFNNVNISAQPGYEYQGHIDGDLAAKISASWANFARTGDPSTSTFKWKAYDLGDRETMTVGADSSLQMVKDPKGQERKLLMFTNDYDI